MRQTVGDHLRNVGEDIRYGAQLLKEIGAAVVGGNKSRLLLLLALAATPSCQEGGVIGLDDIGCDIDAQPNSAAVQQVTNAIDVTDGRGTGTLTVQFPMYDCDRVNGRVIARAIFIDPSGNEILVNKNKNTTVFSGDFDSGMTRDINFELEDVPADCYQIRLDVEVQVDTDHKNGTTNTNYITVGADSFDYQII